MADQRMDGLPEEVIDDVFYDSLEDFSIAVPSLPAPGQAQVDQRIVPTPRPRVSLLVPPVRPCPSVRKGVTLQEPPRTELGLSDESFIDRAYQRHILNPTGKEPEPLTSTARMDPQSTSSFLSADDVVRPRIPRPRASTNQQSTAIGLPETVPRRPDYTLPSSVQSNSQSEGVSSATENLLRTLVSEFTSAVRSQSGPDKMHFIKPPRFDGTGDVHLFIQQFVEVSELSKWSDQIALVRLRGCLEKSAKEAGRAESMKMVFARLLSMFGLTPAQAREKLHHLRRESGESYLKLANRVERLTRLAYGGLGAEVEVQLAMECFDRSLDDPALRQYLSVSKPRTLDETVQAAEHYAMLGKQLPKPAPRRDPARVARVDADVEVDEEGTGSSSKAVLKLLHNLTEKVDSQAKALAKQSSRVVQPEPRRETNRPKPPKAKPRNPAPDEHSKRACYQCGSTSHFKRDCPHLVKTQQSKTSSSEN